MENHYTKLPDGSWGVCVYGLENALSQDTILEKVQVHKRNGEVFTHDLKVVWSGVNEYREMIAKCLIIRRVNECQKDFSPKQQKLFDEGSKLTQEQVAKIHADLQYLASCCDGAVQLDDMGFSAFDTRCGHELANLPSLNPIQAAIGARLCRKYKRQLSG